MKLVVLSVEELGFKLGGTTKEIYKRALELGLELCLPEIGYQLRLQYLEQPHYTILHIAMKPYVNSTKENFILCIGNNNSEGLYIDAVSVSPKEFWCSQDEWVFCLK